MDLTYEIIGEKVKLTHEAPVKVREYELEEIVSIIAGIDREHDELNVRIADNRSRHAQYSIMLPDVEAAIEIKKDRIEAEEAMKEEVTELKEETIISK